MPNYMFDSALKGDFRPHQNVVQNTSYNTTASGIQYSKIIPGLAYSNIIPGLAYGGRTVQIFRQSSGGWANRYLINNVAGHRIGIKNGRYTVEIYGTHNGQYTYEDAAVARPEYFPSSGSGTLTNPPNGEAPLYVELYTEAGVLNGRFSMRVSHINAIPPGRTFEDLTVPFSLAPPVVLPTTPPTPDVITPPVVENVIIPIDTPTTTTTAPTSFWDKLMAWLGVRSKMGYFTTWQPNATELQDIYIFNWF